MYRQVELWKYNKTSHPIKKVCWIPKQFAINGKKITIDNEEGIWNVIKVWDAVLDAPIYPEALIREHRKNTGDSLRKEK